MALENVMRVDNGNIIGGVGGGSKNFQGTIAEWNQLSTAEKKAYDHASIPDSIDGGVTFPANKVVMSDGVTSVEDAVDEVAGEVKVGADAINTTHTIRSAYLIKAGKIVCCSISLTFTSNVSAWATIASLKGATLVASTLCNAVAGGTICQAYVTPSGNIQISVAGTSGQDASITITGIAS